MRKEPALSEAEGVGNLIWAPLAIPFGTLTAGSEMRCHSAMFLEFRDGRIVAQRNYDCFDAW